MNRDYGKVYFIGAGPGDPDLITVKGRRLVEEADLVLYAGSLVPREVVSFARKDARIIDSAGMTLQETHLAVMETVKKGGMVARVHTGDPSLYGAIHEQIALLEQDGISYEIVPGISVAFAAAARAGVSFTLPESAQSLILTRISGRTRVPEREALHLLASHGCSMGIYLSASNPEGMVEELLKGGYPEDTPVFVGYRIGWPDEISFFSVLSRLVEDVKEREIKRQVIFLVLPKAKDVPPSRLYDPSFSHRFRDGSR